MTTARTDPHAVVSPTPAGRVIGPIASPEEMFCAASVPGLAASIDLGAHGYVEEEFFLDGTAHVYGYGDDESVRVEQAGLAYRTRVMVRRPERASDFSGVVQFEPLHPGATYDRVATFADSWRRILRSGDAWVAVSCKPNAVANLRRFDERRYADLHLADRSQLWDLLVHVGLILKQPSSGGLLGGLQARHVYASGWSMTAGFLRTFIADGFHARARAATGVDPFDGYVIGYSSGAYVYGYTPLNDATGPDIDTVENQQRRRTIPPGDPRRVMRPPDGVPVIELMSEAEALTNLPSRRPDSNTTVDRYRLYEVPGRGHVATSSDAFGELSARPMAAVGAFAISHPGVTDTDTTLQGGFPTHLVTQAVFDNLHRWVADGVAPPSADPITLSGTSPVRARVDDLGNAVGGLRHPFVDVPLATYASSSTGDPLAHGPVTPWKESPFATDVLQRLYGNRAGYLTAFRHAIDRAVAEGRLAALDVTEAFEWAAEHSELWFSSDG